MKIESAFNLYKESRYPLISTKTSTIYSRAIGSFMCMVTPTIHIKDINQLHCTKWRNQTLEKISNDDHPIIPSGGKISTHTAIKRITSVKTFFNWCVTSPLTELSETPWNGVETPKRPCIRIPKSMNNETLVQLIKTAQSSNNPSYAARDTALILFLAGGGGRSGGAAALTVENLQINTSSSTAYVTEKGGKTRPLSLNETVTLALINWTQKHPNWRKSQHVFCCLKNSHNCNVGDPLTTHSIYAIRFPPSPLRT